jgi:uncharacterized protein YfaS (alpha-2-macroglobulin family)
MNQSQERIYRSKMMRTVLFLGILGLACFYFVPNSTFASDLQILTVSPKGGVLSAREANSIIVTFNKPMVALAATPEDLGEGPIVVSPPVKGKYRWLGTSTLVFSPVKDFPLASLFKVTVPVGTKSLDGSILSAAYSWTFETLRPDLRATSMQMREEPITLNPIFLLKFSQPMRPERSSGKIRLTDRSGKQAVKISVTRPMTAEIEKYWNLGSDSTLVLKIEPEKALEKATAYQLALEKGLLAAEGDLGLAEGKILDLETFGPLTYLGCWNESAESVSLINPTGGLTLHFSNRVKPADLAAKIRFEPQVQIPEYYAERDWGQTDIFLDVELKPEIDYKLFLPADLPDVYDSRLDEAVVDSFRTGSYLPNVTMVTGPGVLESSGDRCYPIFFVNTDSVRLRMGSIAVDRLIPLLDAKSELFHSNKQMPDSLFLVDRTWEVKGPRNIKQIRPIEVDWLLAGKRAGLVLLEVQEDKIIKSEEKIKRDGKLRKTLRQRAVSAKAAEEELFNYHRALLQVTNLGISAKFSAHNNFVWVTSLKDAMPVGGAKVEVRDDLNRPLWSGLTDAQGMVETPGWQELGIASTQEWEKPRQWILASKDGDVAYTASDWGTGIYPYRFDIYYDWDPNPVVVTGSLFTERGLYRAGDSVHVKGIIREKKYDRWTIPQGKEIILKVHDARSNDIFRQNVKVSEFGSFAVDLPLSVNAALGYYGVSAETLPAADGSGKNLMYGSFRVEAYRPAEFSVDLRSERPSYVLGDTAAAYIHASYLFGSPMSGQKVSWRYYIYPTDFTPQGFADYYFGPLDQYWDESRPLENFDLAQGKGLLDEQGNFRTSAVLVAANADCPLRLNVSADVESPSRQHIAGITSVPLHPAEFYVGLKPATTFAQVGQELGCDVVSVFPDGEISAGKIVSLKLIKRQWNSVRKAGVGGRYEWISKKQDTVIDSAQVITDTLPWQHTFVPRDAGVYYIRAEAQDERGNRTATETYFYAVGAGYVAWERSDDDRVDLIPDATSYKPGDVARVMVKSPFESAQALVTLEREGILSHRMMTLNGSTPTIEIPLAQEHLPNVYVSVILLKGRSSNHVFSAEGEDVGRPAFKIGYTNLVVDPGSRRLQVQVGADKEAYQPGEQVTVRLHVKDYQGAPVIGEVALAVVDLGVLNLIGYELPDPFDVFYGQRPLSVQTSETRLHVVEQRNYGEKGENRGGGGGEGNMEMGMRKVFKATAYWNPAIVTDAQGNAMISFKLPDNLTTFKIMAVAQTKDAAFGRASQKIKVSKPLLMLASLPRFARIGDRFEAGVVVYNYSGKEGKGKVVLEAQGIASTGTAEQAVNLMNSESREVRFPFVAQSLGKATFRFAFRLGDLSDGLELSIPVFAPRKKETVALYQRTDSSTVEEIEVPQKAFKDLSTLELTAASTAMTELNGPLRYLLDYRYDCLEQKISRILPFLVADDLITAFDLSIGPNADYRQTVTKVLSDLENFQTDDGGLALWQGAERSNPYATAYAAYALLLAKKEGYAINADLLDAALDYLRNILTENISRVSYLYDKYSWKATDAFILYVLTLAGRKEEGYVERFYNDRQGLPVIARTFLLKTLILLNPDDPRKATMAQELINMTKVAPTTAYFEEGDAAPMRWIFHSNVRSTALVLDALLESGVDYPLAERVVAWLMERRKGDCWNNTQENFYVLQALARYFARFEKEEPNFTATIRMAGKEILRASFSGRDRRIEEKNIALSEFRQPKLPIQIEKRGVGQLYYGMRMTYYPQDAGDPREEGIAIIKSIQPVDSLQHASGHFLAGEMVKVNLEVVVPMERNYVVVDDPLPAGLEPVNLSFATTASVDERTLDQTQQWWSGFDHVEMHDDRVLLFADWLRPGVHSYSYLARAITQGTFSMPATYAEEMYHPEVYGRTVDREVKIE